MKNMLLELREIWIDWRLGRYERFEYWNRICCEQTCCDHAVEKLKTNIKKATCPEYYPEKCPVCGRKIKYKTIYKYVMLARFYACLENEL